MNNLRNRVQLIGRLGADPEVRVSQKGTQITKMSIATNEFFRDKEGKRQEKTIWHACTAFSHLAEIAGKYLARGREVALEGRITYQQYTDKQGIDRWRTEIQVQDLVMLGKGNKPD